MSAHTLSGLLRIGVCQSFGVGLIVLWGCAPAIPQIIRLTPAVADVTRGIPIEVAVEGRGFAARNTVHFGALEMRQVPRVTSTLLRFQVPLDDTAMPRRGGAPPAPLASGRYDITVTTARGTSNALPFQVQGVAR